MRTSKAAWAIVRREYLERLRSKGVVATLRHQVWATTDSGAVFVLPGMTVTTNPDHWWMGFDQEAFDTRRAVGAILLCAQPDGPLFDFGLPASFIREVKPQLLVGRHKPQLNFNIFRRGGRFELHLVGAPALDITGRRGDVSWLLPRQTHAAPRVDASVARETPTRPSQATEHRFYAKLVNGALQPLDAVLLQQDGVYLVSARRLEEAPTNPALRRILARGGPNDLPSDLAAQHDHYAHGAPKR